jgi:two-component system, chemotaxis family, protein-glutamate methylesterase/glutaminase
MGADPADTSGEVSIVVIGASAGGIAALRRLVSALSGHVNAAFFIVQHSGPDSPGLLPKILQSATVLPVVHAVNKGTIIARRIYVAPPDYHLIIAPGQVLVTGGPKEHFARPAVDPLFRSAALAYGPRVIGVILTGMLDDGTAGLWAVKQRGGIAVVQDPTEAEYPDMPSSALKHVSIDHCLPAAEIGALIDRLSRDARPRDGEHPMPKGLELETRIAKGEHVPTGAVLHLGEPSPFSCPECHGALMRLKDAGIIRFRCHTGHAYSFQSLLQDVNTEIEANLWSAIRTLEESTLLLDYLAKNLDETTQPENRAAIIKQKRDEAEQRAAVIREVITGHTPFTLERTGAVASETEGDG